MEHSFYYRLLAGLKEIYLRKPVKCDLIEDDPFQLWLADRYIDNDIKARVLVQAYYMSLNINISQGQAISLIVSGEIIKPFLDVR